MRKLLTKTDEVAALQLIKMFVNSRVSACILNTPTRGMDSAS